MNGLLTLSSLLVVIWWWSVSIKIHSGVYNQQGRQGSFNFELQYESSDLYYFNQNISFSSHEPFHLSYIVINV